MLPPANLVVNCSDVPAAMVLTSNDVSDNCTAPTDLLLDYTETSTQEVNQLSSAHYTYLINRTWTVRDNAGNERTGTQEIMVQDLVAPVAVCKNVQVVLGVNGTATILPEQLNNGSADNCAATNVLTFTATPTTFTEQNIGATNVVLTVTDPCGNAGSCTAQVMIGSQCDQGPNDSQLWNETYWYDAVMEQNDLCESPADPAFIFQDSCTTGQIYIQYQLYLDLDGNGVPETVVNSQKPQEPNLVYFGNAANPNYTGGEPRAFDQRGVPFNEQYRFDLERTINGNTVTAHVRWTTLAAPTTYLVPQLPHGTHRIRWFMNDDCHNKWLEEKTFQLYDCKKPVIECRGGAIVNINSNDKVTLGAKKLLLAAVDNCTPDAKLAYAVRKAGQGSGLPLNGDGSLASSLTFTCAELGDNPVELWVTDKAGNVESCTTVVTVRDLFGYCGQGTVGTAGVTTDENTGQESTKEEAESGQHSTPQQHTADGFALYQNEPNPFLTKTTIGFYLPAAAVATLRVYDETGRLIHTTQGDFAKGRNAFTIDLGAVDSEGLFYYRLSTPTDSAVRKMVQVKD